MQATRCTESLLMQPRIAPGQWRRRSAGAGGAIPSSSRLCQLRNANVSGGGHVRGRCGWMMERRREAAADGSGGGDGVVWCCGGGGGGTASEADESMSDQ